MADASTQTSQIPLEHSWEHRARELHKVNTRLQTALIAATADPERDLRSVLRDVNRPSYAKARPMSAVGGVRSLSAREPRTTGRQPPPLRDPARTAPSVMMPWQPRG